jgi:ABC-type lipoprotein release transport system permease subunit
VPWCASATRCTTAFGALVGGIAVALVVGALAGLYPAARAAPLQPAEAVRRPG